MGGKDMREIRRKRRERFGPLELPRKLAQSLFYFACSLKLCFLFFVESNGVINIIMLYLFSINEENEVCYCL